MQSSVSSVRYEKKYLSVDINKKGQRLIFLVHLHAIYWKTGISLLKKIEMRQLQLLLLCWLSQTLHFRIIPHASGEGIYAFMLPGLPNGGTKNYEV
jgi:hypothetical protein